MKRKWILIVTAVLVIVAGVVVVKTKQKALAALPTPQVAMPTVQTAPVKMGTLEETIHYMGMIEPYTKADLSARISGSILSIEKREGDSVREGEMLVSIDDRELVQRAAAAQSELLSARQKLTGIKSAYETQKNVYDRDVLLAKSGAISEEALERSRAATDGARSAMDALAESIKGLEMNSAAVQTQVGYARLCAPFNGLVSKRWSDPGDMATPGKPILTLEKEAQFKVTVLIPQEELAGMRRDGKAYLSNGDSTMPVTISRVYPALGKNILGSVEMVMPASPFGLPSGSTVGVDLVKKVVTGAIVPENAVVKNSTGNFVCVVNAGVIHIRPVKVLGSGRGKTAIEGELVADEQCAVGQENRLLTLADGSKIAVAGEPK